MEQQKKFKSGKSRRETAVQGTNDSSIVSKCSMAAAGYFDDPFLKEFVSKTAKRSPLINRGYYIRATAIDFLLKKFLSSDSKKKQILSLGAGFDSAYFRLKSQGLIDNVMFCEIDFCDVVKRKHTVISTNSTLNSLIPGYFTQSEKDDPLIEINTDEYKLLGVDLTQHNTLEALLKICGIDFDNPTLLLSECVLTYMTKRCSSNVIQWASETFSNSTFVLYEQINPNDSFGLFMQNHFRTIGSALKCINAFPTMDSQLQRFKQLGWEQSEAMDMNQFYYNLVSEEERNRVEWLEPFDEYEEWHLKCAHYMVLCAYNKTCESLLSGFTKDVSLSSNIIPSCVTIEALVDLTSILRIGHASTVVNGVIVTVAGFGEEYGKHQRLSSIMVTDTKTFKSKLLNLDVDLDKIEIVRLRHTQCPLKDGSTVLIGGRMSPTYSCTQVIQLLLNCHDSTGKYSEGTEICPQTNGTENSFCKGSHTSTELTNEDVLNGASRKTETHDSNYEFVNSKDRKVNQNKDESKKLNCVTQNETLTLNSDSRHSDKNSVNIQNMNLTSPHLNAKSNETHSNKDMIDRQNASDTKIKEKPKCLSDNKSKQNTDSNKINSNCDKKDIVILETINCDYKSDNKERNDIESVSLTCSVIKQTGYIPVPRWRHSAVVCQKAGKEMIFVYGGRNETRLALNCGYLFDPDNGQLSQVCSSVSEPGYRQSHTASIWNNQVIIAGGLDLQLRPVNSIYMLDVENLVWRSFDVTGELLPRYSHTAQVMDNLLVLIGGVNLCHQSPGVAVINLLTGACAEYALSVPDPDFLVLLHQHQICYLGNGRFVVIGGGGNCFSFGTLLNRSPFILDINKCVQHFTQTVCNKNGLTS